MSQCSERNAEKRKKQAEKYPCWYYDACALDREYLQLEIVNAKDYNFIPVTSHLAIGEAVGNWINDERGKNKDAKLAKTNAFLDYLKDLIRADKLKVTGNDFPHELLQDLVEATTDGKRHLSISDRMHLGTAIECGCKIFKSRDSGDFTIKNQKRIKEIAREHGVDNFSFIMI